MTFGQAINDGFSKYVLFSGRSSRSAYWWFVLLYVLALVGASILDTAANTQVFGVLVVLGFLLPCLAVLVRRLHDTDRSGWWALISLVPFVGSIVLIVFACTDSGPPNKWGEGPDGKSNLSVTSPHRGVFPPPAPPAAPSPPPSQMPPPDESERAPD